MQKFKDNRKIKTVTSTLVFLFVIGIGVYFLRGSYAKYEVVDSFTLIEGQVPSFTKIKSISGNIVENLPTIASTDENSCGDNGVVQVSHTGVTGTTNDAEFQKTEYRYCGTDPNNYVTFNEEEAGWRIIGLVNTPEGQRIKLIRAESIGDYSWDYTSSGTYTNDWSTSTLQSMLNSGAYYNRTTGEYYNDSTTATNVDFSTNGLTEEAKSMIDTVTWNLGGDANHGGLASQWYSYERGETVYNGHATIWLGEVGLIYPSDYGYATGGGSKTNRSACLQEMLYNWATAGMSNCYENNWLYKSQADQWTLSPFSSDSVMVYSIYAEPGVYLFSFVDLMTAVLPTLYLKPNVQITDEKQNGSKEHPYELTLQ